MAKFKVLLWSHDKNKLGEFPIYLRITKDRRVKYISLGMSTALKQWDDEYCQFKPDKRLNPDHINKNAFINAQKNKVKDIVVEFERQKIDWTLNQFEDAFLNRAIKGKVEPYFVDLIKTQRETGHIGNARCYDGTLGILKLYDKDFANKEFREIDLRFIKNFDLWLQTPRKTTVTSKKGKVTVVERSGCCGNTRKYYLKALRAVLNKAIKDKVASQDTYPFGSSGFELAGLEEVTAKRYLPTEYLDRIKSAESTIFENEYARCLFLFSYYCYGMSFVDMAHLTSSNVQHLEGGNYIVQKRQKTKNGKNSKSIQIKITVTITELINRLIKLQPAIDSYLLPIVTKSGLKGEKLYEHVRGRYSKYNDYLSALASELKIDDVNITTYTSRHTMAMTLQSNEVSREVISQILGHKDLETTNTYLDSFSSKVIDEAAELL